MDGERGEYGEGGGGGGDGGGGGGGGGSGKGRGGGGGARIVEVYNNQWFQHAHVIPLEMSSPGLAVCCVICWQN